MKKSARIVVLLSAALSCLSLRTFAQELALFSRIDAPSGVAATPGKLFVTEYCGDRRHILTVDEAGNATIFATLPSTGGGCSEIYITVSPGFGGFPGNYIYVTYGQQVLQVTPDGQTVTVFATIPSLENTHSSLTFDHVGTFMYNLIVTGYNGEIWEVDSHGNTTHIATLPTRIEGPVVAPKKFGRFGGKLWVAAENANEVFAITRSGTSTDVGAWVFAENVSFIPTKVCEFGRSGGAYFATVFPDLNGNQGLIKFPASQFTHLSGSALVTREKNAGIGLFALKGNTVWVTNFAVNTGNHEGAAMVDCSVPLEVTIKVLGTQPDLEDRDGAHIDVAILSTASFDASARVLPKTLKFGSTGNEKSFDRCEKVGRDVNNDGLPDLVCSFDSDDAGLSPTDTTVHLQGITVDGLRISGTTNFQLKVLHNTNGSD